MVQALPSHWYGVLLGRLGGAVVSQAVWGVDISVHGSMSWPSSIPPPPPGRGGALLALANLPASLEL